MSNLLTEYSQPHLEKLRRNIINSIEKCIPGIINLNYILELNDDAISSILELLNRLSRLDINKMVFLLINIK